MLRRLLATAIQSLCNRKDPLAHQQLKSLKRSTLLANLLTAVCPGLRRFRTSARVAAPPWCEPARLPARSCMLLAKCYYVLAVWALSCHYCYSHTCFA